jgi:hypothetical protein
VLGFASYFTRETYFDKASKVQEFRDSLSRFARDPLIYLCAAVNALIKCWQGGAPDKELHSKVVRSLFESSDTARLITGSLEEPIPRFVFHRQQLLFLAKEAILHCQKEGLDPLIQKPGIVGRIFLLANDHLHYAFRESNSTDMRSCRHS